MPVLRLHVLIIRIPGVHAGAPSRAAGVDNKLVCMSYGDNNMICMSYGTINSHFCASSMVCRSAQAAVAAQ